MEGAARMTAASAPCCRALATARDTCMFIQYSMRSLNALSLVDACRTGAPAPGVSPKRSCAMNTPVAPPQVVTHVATQIAVEPSASHPMPEIATFVASLKAAFGAAVIDDAIRRGKEGEPTFHARENGRSVGTAGPAAYNAWHVDGDTLRDRYFCAGCDGSCVGQSVSCRVKGR